MRKSTFFIAVIFCLCVIFKAIQAGNASNSIAYRNNENKFSGEVLAIPTGLNIYVSSKGSTEGDGSAQNPFIKITQGIQAAKYGDNVIVLPGSYTESVDMKKGVSIIGFGAHETELIGDNEEYVVKGNDDAVLKGFSIIPPITSNMNIVLCDGTSPIISDNMVICHNLS